MSAFDRWLGRDRFDAVREHARILEALEARNASDPSGDAPQDPRGGTRRFK